MCLLMLVLNVMTVVEGADAAIVGVIHLSGCVNACSRGAFSAVLLLLLKING
jgi:sulfite reductase beta subunit-like hemoprotein